MDALSAKMMVDQPGGSEQRRSKIVPAARWVSIDYRSIVENAVAGLANNTPDARRDVYAEARGVVHRHLQLMRLPEPIVELEKLALDLTIRKVERQARATQAVPEAEEDLPERAEPTLGDAVRSFGSAVGELAQAFTSLMIVLGLRPVFYALWVVAAPIRFIGRAIFSPVGLAAGLPIAAMLGITIYLLDSDASFQNAVTARAARFLEHVDAWLNEPSPALAGKDEERVADRAEPPPSSGTAPAHAVPARARVTASSRGRNGVYTPPSETDAVGASAHLPAPKASPSGPAVKPSLAASAPTAVPKWFTSYANVSEAAPTSSAALEAPPPAPPTPSAGSGPAPYQLAAANSMAAISDDQPLTPPSPTISLPPLRLPSPKVAALIETGKKAATADDLEKAVRDFTEAVRVDPNYPGGYTERGQALFKLGETDHAIADYTAALKRDPNFGPALRSRAMANLYRGATELALADLSKAIQVAEIDPNRLSPLELFYARRSRATIYGNRMQHDGEIADCTAIIEAYKRDKTLDVALMTVYQAEGASNLIATIYRQRANAYIRQSNPELARADLTAAMSLSADRGFSALVDRARLNEALGQRDQAIMDLQSALNIRPGSEEARIALRRISSGPPARPPGRT
jgi:tetratricopeptide (TPR) repeat protein